jgi:2-oxoglutarate dehydrogenase E2 component (dihydrolipoamide succinyltransferase)
MIEIKVPDLGESITEGAISEWLIKEGEAVHAGDIILEIETDKVNLEVNADHDGILTEIKKQKGETVEVGEVIALLNEEANDSSGDTTSDTNTDKETENDKPTETDTDQDIERDKKTDANSDQGTGKKNNSSIASPAVRKLARERGVDLNQVQVKDPMGKITKDDINNSKKETSAPKQTNKSDPIKSDDKGKKSNEAKETFKPVERQRMSRRRLTIANRLVEAQQTAAMLTTFNEVDMTAILDIRSRRKEAFREKYDVGLGFMSFFSKAVVGALKAFPLLNAEIDGEDIVIKKFYDIGVAVSAKEGLIVPVLRDVDALSFAQIEQQITSLAQKARNNSLSMSEIQGGSFTITNGGVFGSLLSTPILNTPQVGILGMHKIQTRPVTIQDDKMENRPMMYIALSYDHRIVDGSEAVQFLVKVKELLEDPETLLIEGS